MIKAKVLIPFTDKETKKKYKKGEIISLTATRFNEVISHGKLIEAVEEAASKIEK